MISYVLHLIPLSITMLATMFHGFNDARIGSAVSRIQRCPWTPCFQPWVGCINVCIIINALRIQPSESTWQFISHVQSTKQILKIWSDKWGGQGRPCSDGLGFAFSCLLLFCFMNSHNMKRNGHNMKW